ncbi:MAG: hypothetical protein ABSC51_09030 [Gaiellaceae bacterium]
MRFWVPLLVSLTVLALVGKYIFHVIIGGLFAIALLILLFGCNSRVGHNPDPHGKLMLAMSHDPIFAILPPGATNIHIEKSPPKYQDSGPFEGSGWSGPSFSLLFRDRRPESQIKSFFVRRAIATGWGPGRWAHEWKKSFGRGAVAYLSLVLPAWHSDLYSIAMIGWS